MHQAADESAAAQERSAEKVRAARALVDSRYSEKSFKQCVQALYELLEQKFSAKPLAVARKDTDCLASNAK